MKNHKFQVWVKKDSPSFIVEVPFSDVKDAHEFIWDAIGVRPRSMSKI